MEESLKLARAARIVLLVPHDELHAETAHLRPRASDDRRRGEGGMVGVCVCV